jgi:23S rRNA pseudouridine2605 synthase
MTTPEETDDRRERVAKVIARAGLCSRREAEEWIAAGRVAINGTVLDTPAHTVGEDDRVTVDGEPLPAREPTRLWLYHKPRGLVTTNSDPDGRPTVFEHLPVELPRVVTIGRLDINTEGLLLLTNDGGLARMLELPATGWLRRYRVRAHGEVTQADLDRLQDGVAVDGVLYGPVEATLDRVQGANAWLMIGIREGKNREVKQVLGTLGLEVSRLIRISFGPFQLADLEPGEVREIRGRILRDQLGERLAEEAGCVFSTGRDADDDRPRGKAAAKAPRTLKGKPAPGEAPAAARPGARERAAGAGRGRAGDRPLSGGGERSRGMISRDEGRSRGTRSHEDGGGRGAPRSRGARPVEGDRPANHRPRVLAPTDWTGEYAAEGPAPKKEDRPQKRGARSDGPREGARGEGSRGGPRGAASRTFGGEGPRSRSAGPRSSEGDAPRGRGAPRSAGSRGEAPGGDERPPRVGRPSRGTSVWRADDAGGRPLRARETGARVERPARGDDAPPSRARGAFDRPRAEGDRPVRRRPDVEGAGWSPPTGPVTASDTPSRRMKARARDAGLLGDAAPERPARAPRRPAPEGAERPARAPRAGGDRPYTPRTPRAEGDRPVRSRAPRAEGERTYTPRAPRGDGERTYTPRAPRGDGERTYKPRPPRADGDRPARAPRAEGERTYKPRAPRGDGERSYTPRPPRAEGERSYTPRAPRGDGERTYKPRPPRADGDRPARPPRAEGERTYKPRPPRAEGDRPARPPRAGGPAGSGRPPRAGKPSFGGDRPSGPPKGRPRSDGPRGAGPKGAGPKGSGPRSGGPKGRPSGGAPRGRPRGGA